MSSPETRYSAWNAATKEAAQQLKEEILNPTIQDIHDTFWEHFRRALATKWPGIQPPENFNNTLYSLFRADSQPIRTLAAVARAPTPGEPPPPNPFDEAKPAELMKLTMMILHETKVRGPNPLVHNLFDAAQKKLILQERVRLLLQSNIISIPENLREDHYEDLQRKYVRNDPETLNFITRIVIAILLNLPEDSEQAEADEHYNIGNEPDDPEYEGRMRMTKEFGTETEPPHDKRKGTPKYGKYVFTDMYV